MLRVATLLLLLLLGTALADGASIGLLRSAPTPARVANSPAQSALLARSWLTIKAMFR